MRDDFLDLMAEGTQPPTPLRRWVGQVTRSDARGVYATELGADEAHPSGPLRGATYRDVRTCPDGPHTHPLTQLPRGTAVLVEQTDHGPWVIRYDEGSLPQ